VLQFRSKCSQFISVAYSETGFGRPVRMANLPARTVDIVLRCTMHSILNAKNKHEQWLWLTFFQVGPNTTSMAYSSRSHANTVTRSVSQSVCLHGIGNGSWKLEVPSLQLQFRIPWRQTATITFTTQQSEYALDLARSSMLQSAITTGGVSVRVTPPTAKR